MSAVAREYGCTFKDVRRQVIAQGIPRNKHWGAAMRRSKVSAEVKATLWIATPDGPRRTPVNTPEEIRRRILAATVGRPVSEETRLKMRATMLSAPVQAKLRGRKVSSETRQRMSRAQTGHPVTEETRAAIKAGVNRPEALAKKAAAFGRWATQAGRSNTPIEKLLQAALTLEEIPFVPNKRLGRYFPDIRLTEAPLLIEADGWLHQLPANRAHDERRDAELQAMGFRTLRFTGHELRTNMASCMARIREELQSEAMRQSALAR
jgi:very-short-patch-repair endonuclease